MQKGAQRTLRDDKKAAFIADIRGKIPAVTMLVEIGWEPRMFAQEIEIALSQAGVPIHVLDPRPNAVWPREIASRIVPFAPSTGAIMYAPGFNGNGAKLADDPLGKALTAGGIFGGGFDGPKLLEGLNPNEYAIYVGEKAR